MTASILNGKEVAKAKLLKLKQTITEHQQQGKRKPALAVIRMGNDPASIIYVNHKIKTCAEIGIQSHAYELSQQTTQSELLQLLEELNQTEEIDGILVQLPLPAHIDKQMILEAISPNKDVDGFHPVNVGKMVLGFPTFISATPYGILLLLKHYEIETNGKSVIVIGRSNIVGTPVSILLSRNNDTGNATVTLCHSRTKNIKELCKEADIIIAAIGKPHFVTKDMVKEGAVIIDVGINHIKDESKKSGFALAGDVDFKNVSAKAGYISPVPGGVGLMTIAALLMNTYKACVDRNLMLEA